MTQHKDSGARSVPTEQVPMDFKEDGAADPYENYAEMRRECPVARVRKRDGLRPFLITRYADAKAALLDPRLSKDPQNARDELRAAGLEKVYLEGEATLADNMLFIDPPDHTRLRRLVAGKFTARRTAELGPRIQEITDELIDAMVPAGRADFIADFAVRLPVLVIAELLGLPAEDREMFRLWSQEALRPQHDVHQAALWALSLYVTEIVAHKRIEPGDDLISAMIEGRDGDLLTESELLGSIRLLIIAGHETTVNLLGNGMLALLRDPAQADLLRERPELIPGAVEEFLRFDSPVERATARYAAEDVRIAETFIPRGSVVYAALGSANRDSEEFPEADRMDVTRAPSGHLAFGHGLHFCLGAPLARLETRIAFETLLRRLPKIELDAPEESLIYQQSVVMRGLTELPIRFQAAESTS